MHSASPSRPLGFWIVLLCAVAVGVLSAAPYIAQTFSPAYRSLTVIRDKDYANYYSRLERALSGYHSEAGNGITTIGSGIEGMQTAGMESAVAFLFGWTGLPAPSLSVLVTAILAPLLFLLFFTLFRTMAFPDRWSLGMTVLLFFVMFHGLTRVMHPGWSFVPAVAALAAFFVFLKRPSVLWVFAAGILLGLLPYLYFWSWTFVWAAAGSVALLDLCALGRKSIIVRHWPKMLGLGLIVAVFSLPFVLETAALMHNSLYPEVAVRASFLYERSPESWPRTVLLLVTTLSFLSLFPRYGKEYSYRFTAGALLGILIAMHQNIFHNRILMFSSHFYPHLLIAVTIAGAWVLLHRAPLVQRVIVAGIAAVFLAAGVYDYAFAHRFFIPQPWDFRYQHLTEPIALLKNNTGATVLTDADTGRVLTSWDPVGIVYTHHVRFLFISDAAMAERYCVVELFSPVSPVPHRALYIEYNHVLDSPAMREREKNLVSEACGRVRARPEEYLKKYEVTHVLWNQKERPEWVIESRKKAFGLSEQASGSGWVLWTISPLPAGEG